jgi:hypothetical protein
MSRSERPVSIKRPFWVAPALLAVFPVAGALIAAFVDHRLGRPAWLPNEHENDASTALAL